MTTIASQRTRLTDALAESRDKLRGAVDALTDEQLREPAIDEWSVKDLLAHVASWDELVGGDLLRLQRGHAPYLGAFMYEKIDQYNDVVMAGRKAWELPQVRHELDASRAALLSSLPGLREGSFVEGQAGATFLSLLAKHESDHAAAITEWRSKRGG